MSLPDNIQQQLDHPVDPQGREITWEHPFLVFLAEHGRICASEKHETESAGCIIKCGRAVSKSTTMARQIEPTKVGDLVIPAPRLPANPYLLEFYAYQTVVRDETEFYRELHGEPYPFPPEPGVDKMVVEDVQRSTDEHGVETEHVKLRGTRPIR